MVTVHSAGYAIHKGADVPTYFFDVFENGRSRPDDFGIDLDSLYEARIQAIALLPHIAQAAFPDGDRQVFKVVVRCAEQRVRYVATMTLDGIWVEPPTRSDPAP